MKKERLSLRKPKHNRKIYKGYRYGIDMGTTNKKQCEHNLTRKLYFQRGNKWVTTNFSICDACGKIIKKVAQNG